MRFLSILLIIFVMFMCIAPAFEHDDCMLRDTCCLCQADSTADEDCACETCSPFISCATCTGFIPSPEVRTTVLTVSKRPVFQFPPLPAIPDAFLQITTPPPIFVA